MSIGQSVRPRSAVDVFIDTSAWPSEQAAFARALFDALERYEPKEYNGRTLVYASRTQPLFHLLQVDAAWQKISAGTEIVHIDGTHLSILREPRVTVLANDLRCRLASADPASGHALLDNSDRGRPTP
jgi:thioesterase domain-containing protein